MMCLDDCGGQFQLAHVTVTTAICTNNWKMPQPLQQQQSSLQDYGSTLNPVTSHARVNSRFVWLSPYMYWSWSQVIPHTEL